MPSEMTDSKLGTTFISNESPEKNSADHKPAEDWTRNVFPAIVSKSYTYCIYNADETGIVYKALSIMEKT